MLAAQNLVVNVLSIALTIAWLLLLIRVIVSWMEFLGVRMPIAGPFRSAYDLLIEVTEFGLRPLRKIVPPTGMFDISVLVAFVIIFVAQQALRSAGG
jgi:YggT family protein